jgi:tetratricopeptide (TPR) repeat protein/serine/threonine protein kinase
VDEEAIFAAALGKPSPEERRAFLAEACSADAELRARVEALLAAHENPDSFLEPCRAGLVPTVDEPSFRERPGTMIGPYKLMEQIGEGGMGLVFVAEQQHPVRRKVALKVLKPGMDTRQVVARFEAERQALALMDHPNIATVHDGGETATGRPYFVMELVKGVPITAYCDDNRLTPRQRLELFVDVCQAVQHAHQKGIIHRDLKPSNVLVSSHDGVPVVKVIDFGVAKAIGQQLTDKTLYTQLSQFIGTPLYMSPEQAGQSSLDVDTRSDIYALGVLLYELLTGTTPFDKDRLQEVGYDELRRIIREEEPPRPSTRLSTLGQAATTISMQRQSDPKRLSQLIRGELDWIVMKCLEKDRNRRYETANSLIQDIVCYLHDEPVQACPPSAGYRLRKFVRRHKGPMAAVCIVFLVLVGGIITTTWGFLTARAAKDAEAEARQRAQEHFQIAKTAVDDYLTGVTEDPDLKRADFNKLRKKLLEAAVPFYQRFVEQKPGDAALEAERGRAYFRLALLRDNMGEKAEALANCAQARTIFAKLAAELPTVPDYRLNLAKSHGNLGNLLANLGQRDQAEAAYRAALVIQEKLAADFPTVPQYRQDLAASHNNLGALLKDVGKHDQAEVAYREALTIRDKLATDFPTEPRCRQDLALSHNNVAVLLRELGKYHQAEAAHRAALAIQDKLAADFPTVPQYRQELARSHNNLGILRVSLGQRDQAEAAYRTAIIIEDKLAADFPTVPQYRQELAISHNNLGHLLADLGQRDQAEAAYRTAMIILEKLAADFPTVPDYAVVLGGSYCNFGNLIRNGDGAQDALEWYRKAIQVLREVLAKDNRLVTARLFLRNSHWSRARALDRLNRHAEAMKDWDWAIELDPKDVIAWCNRGVAYSKLGQWDKAVADYSQAIELEPKYVWAWNGRGAVYCDHLGQYDKAVSDFSKVIELEAKFAHAWHNRGVAYRNQGQLEKALADFSKAVELDPKDAHFWDNRGETYRRMSRFEQAVGDFSKAIELDPKSAHSWECRGWIYMRVGPFDKAVADLSKSIELGPAPERLNNLAWLLATCRDPKVRDPVKAVELAKKTVEAAPKNGIYWQTLAWAQYRAGDWRGAIASIQKVKELGSKGDSVEWFLLAMAHERQGNKQEARKWYDAAVKWMQKNSPNDEELRRFRAEAAELLGVQQTKD